MNLRDDLLQNMRKFPFHPWQSTSQKFNLNFNSCVCKLELKMGWIYAEIKLNEIMHENWSRNEKSRLLQIIQLVYYTQQADLVARFNSHAQKCFCNMCKSGREEKTFERKWEFEELRHKILQHHFLALAIIKAIGNAIFHC